MSTQEIIAVLNSAIEPRNLFRFSRRHKVFQGSISHDGFKITRIIHYENSFLPVIRGTFRLGQSGITVSVRMRIHPLVAAFMCVWFAGVGLGVLIVLAGLLSGRIEPSPVLLIPFGMLLFFWALFSGGFWFEANKAKRILMEMFHQRQTNEQGAKGDEVDGAPYLRR